MFFYTRYPSSNMLKMFFSDVKVSEPPPTLTFNVWIVTFWKIKGGRRREEGRKLVTWCRLTSLVQVSSLTNVGQPTGGVREMLNATAVAIGQGQWRLHLRGKKRIPARGWGSCKPGR